MPGTFFTTKERERLAGFPYDIPHGDLITYLTLTEHDRSLIDTYHGDANRLGTALQTYGRRRMTRRAHFNAILHHLGFRRVQPEDHASILTWLAERALEHDQPTRLFQTVCEHLQQQHMLRPAVTTVVVIRTLRRF